MIKTPNNNDLISLDFLQFSRQPQPKRVPKLSRIKTAVVPQKSVPVRVLVRGMQLTRSVNQRKFELHIPTAKYSECIQSEVQTRLPSPFCVVPLKFFKKSPQRSFVKQVSSDQISLEINNVLKSADTMQILPEFIVKAPAASQVRAPPLKLTLRPKLVDRTLNRTQIKSQPERVKGHQLTLYNAHQTSHRQLYRPWREIIGLGKTMPFKVTKF